MQIEKDRLHILNCHTLLEKDLRMLSKSSLCAYIAAAVLFAGTATTGASAAQTVPTTSPAQTVQITSPLARGDQAYYIRQRNLQLVFSLYAVFFNRHQLGYANEIIRPDYIQHNPAVATGRQSFINFFALLFEQSPQFQTTITQAGADGDRVWVQSHQRNSPSVLGLDIIDIYRIQDGKIAEHWDSIEPVVATSLNANTQF